MIYRRLRMLRRICGVRKKTIRLESCGLLFL